MAEKKQKRGGWGLFLLFWTMLLLMLGFIACVFLYRYAAAYEETRPEKTMDALMSMSEEEWRGELLASLKGEVSEFEDISELYNGYFDSVVAGKTLSYRRDMANSGDGRSVFNVYAGAARVCRVTLVPGGDKVYDFGRREWVLESIEPNSPSDTLEAITVEIDAPAGEELFINGKPVSEDYIVDRAVVPEMIGELESRFEVRPAFVRYSVSPLYGDVTVSGADGAEIAPLGAIENGVCRYFKDVDLSGKYSFRAEAPEGVTVTVCGAALDDREVTGSNGMIFAGLSPELVGDGYLTLEYSAGGLYTEPVLSAEYEGESLEPVVGADGKYYFFYPSDSRAGEEERKAAEDFFEAYMHYSLSKYNGASLNELLDLILPDTELYRYAKNSYDAMIWASSTKVEFDELSYDNFHFVSDDCFTCTIVYKADFTAQQWHAQVSYAEQEGYKMVFVRRDGKWLAASMSAFGS